jgi:hypothetical protein
MSLDNNEVRMTGTVDRIRRIDTRTNSAMAEVNLEAR